MNKDYAFEVRRELLHIITGMIIIFASIFLGGKAIWLLFFALIFGTVISLISVRYRVPFFSYMLDKFDRPEHRKKFPGKGLLFFFAGSILVLKLLPLDRNIALASIAILAFGDSVSHLFGLKDKSMLGKHSKKSFTGTLAGIVAAFIAALFFVNPVYAFIGAFCAMAAENFSVKIGFEEVDDNIIVPVIAGTVMYLLSKILII